MPRRDPAPSEHSPAAEAGEGSSVLTEPAVSDGKKRGYASPLAVTGLLKQLLHFDLTESAQSLRSAARDAALAAVRTCCSAVWCERSCSYLCFRAFWLLHLVTAGIDKVLDLPVLNTLNTIGGGALGTD